MCVRSAQTGKNSRHGKTHFDHGIVMATAVQSAILSAVKYLLRTRYFVGR